jgi:hypothetical protein
MATGAPDWIGIYWALKTLIDNKLGTIDANIAAQLAALTTGIQASLTSIQISDAASQAALTVTIQNTLNAISANTLAATLASLQQLADVLNTVKTHDGKGNIYMVDSFENGMGEWAAIIGVNADLWVARNQRKTGAHSMAFTLPNSPSVGCSLNRHIPGFLSGKVGIEASFTTPLGDCEVQLSLHNVGDGSEAGIVFMADQAFDDRFTISSSGGGQTKYITMRGMEKHNNMWQTAKIVADFTSGLYLYAVINGIYYDLTNRPLFNNINSGNHGRVSIGIHHSATYFAANLVYFDDVIMTKE